MDSLEIRYGISGKSGQCPWILWTKLREPTHTGHCPWTQWKIWTLSNDTLDKVQADWTMYRKVPKFSDARKLCCNLPKIQGKRPNLVYFSCRSSLIWVCTVCPDLSVRKLRVITVYTESMDSLDIVHDKVNSCIPKLQPDNVDGPFPGIPWTFYRQEDCKSCTCISFFFSNDYVFRSRDLIIHL